MASRGWEHVTASEAARMGRQARDGGVGATIAKPSKYRNVRVVVDGHTFDSKREAAIYGELRLRERTGQIRNLQLQVPFDLLAPVLIPDLITKDGSLVIATYVADFVFDERTMDMYSGDDVWRRVVADCKGGRNTQMFQLKKKWLFLQQGIEIREIR